MSNPAPGQSITIDLQDLRDGAHLKHLLSTQGQALFHLGLDFTRVAAGGIGQAAFSKPIPLTLTRDLDWKCDNGCVFSLGVQSRCQLSVSDRSTPFAVATTIDSTKTNELALGPEPGFVWVNLELDFSLKGSVSGAGNVSGVGISGRASGQAAATFVYCHRVEAATPGRQAILETLSSLAFPFHPDCALRMAEGDTARVLFSATLGLSAKATYGLGDFRFSAPDAEKALSTAVSGMVKPTLPSAEVSASAFASISWKHSNQFSAIIEKSSPAAAHLHLLQSSGDELDLAAGVKAKIEVSGVEVNVDSKALAGAIDSVAPGAGAPTANLASKLEAALNKKTQDYLNKVNGEISLQATLSRQSKRTLLYSFRADLNAASLPQAWSAFTHGDLSTVQSQGLTLEAGSGVSEHLSRKIGIQLHFFDLFHFSSTSEFFRNCTASVTADGTILYQTEIGRELTRTYNKNQSSIRVFFVATRAQGLEPAPADLCIELECQGVAAKIRGSVQQFAGALGSFPSARVAPVQKEIRDSAGRLGHLTITALLRPTAYANLTFSPFTGPKYDIPPATATEDAANWRAFHDAAATSLQLDFLDRLDYGSWTRFNLAATGARQPDRHNAGNIYGAAALATLPTTNDSTRLRMAYFLASSAHFMNLCEHLQALSSPKSDANPDAAWNQFQSELDQLISKDMETDWIKPTAAALCARLGGAGVEVERDAPDDATLQFTVTLS